MYVHNYNYLKQLRSSLANFDLSYKVLFYEIEAIFLVEKALSSFYHFEHQGTLSRTKTKAEERGKRSWLLKEKATASASINIQLVYGSYKPCS